jgi:hypothetical protein
LGSQLAQNNVSYYQIAKLLGYSPEICIKHYAAIAPEHLTGVAEFAKPAQANSAG